MSVKTPLNNKNENTEKEENLKSYSDESSSCEDRNSFQEEEEEEEYNWITPEKNDINKFVKRITKGFLVAREENKVCCKNIFSQT